MRKVPISVAIFIIFAASTAEPTMAQEEATGASASLKRISIDTTSDYRVNTLKTYLSSQGSPLTEYASDFVAYADATGLDYRLVPAIAGVESTFGKQIPQGSFNAYGWAGGEYRFNSWQDSIKVVSSALKTNYIEKGAVTIDQIARIYCPPSNTWAWKVKYFMTKIDPLPLSYDI